MHWISISLALAWVLMTGVTLRWALRLEPRQRVLWSLVILALPYVGPAGFVIAERFGRRSVKG